MAKCVSDIIRAMFLFTMNHMSIINLEHTSNPTTQWHKTFESDIIIGNYLIECPSTVWSSTEAGDLVVFDGELVIIGDLLSHRYVSLRVDHNLLQGTKIDHFGIAIGL